MSSLAYLYMRGNQLKGPFPRMLQKLQQLTVLDISHNSFSGSIPRILDFPFLRELRLQSNEFMGSVSDTLFLAEKLELLDLRNNKFSRMTLKTVDKISNLRVFLLQNNKVQSHIPEKICELGKVSLLDLSHNKFKGIIPSCFSNVSFGAEGYNGVESFATPSFLGIQFLQNWSYSSALYIDDANLESGDQTTPTTTVDFLTKSRYERYQGDTIGHMYGLDLSSNQLSGDIPVEIGDLQNIRSLNLSRNRLTGSIPDSISKLKDLESLDLSINKLDGNIPPQQADLNNLGYFNVSLNNLSGEIPVKAIF